MNFTICKLKVSFKESKKIDLHLFLLYSCCTLYLPWVSFAFSHPFSLLSQVDSLFFILFVPPTCLKVLRSISILRQALPIAYLRCILPFPLTNRNLLFFVWYGSEPTVKHHIFQH